MTWATGEVVGSPVAQSRALVSKCSEIADAPATHAAGREDGGGGQKDYVGATIQGGNQ